MHDENEGVVGEEEFGQNDSGMEETDGEESLMLDEEDSYDPDDRYH